MCLKVYLMKRTNILAFIVFFSLLPLFSSPVFFAGVHGDVSFPGLNKGDKIFGMGGGASIELGAYVGNFSAGLVGGLSFVNDGGSLISEFSEKKIGLEAGFTFDKNILDFLPEWLGIRPNAALFADFYSAEGYRSESKKIIGRKEKTDGLAFIGEAAIFIDFINLLKTESLHFIPTLGYNYTFRAEEDEGLLHSSRLSLGVRMVYTPTRVDYDEWLASLDHGEAGALTVSAPTRAKKFTPDGDGVEDTVIFDVTHDAAEHGGLASWELRVYDPGNNLFWRQKGTEEIETPFTWTGESLSGAEVESGCLYQYVWYVKANDGSDGFIPGLISTGIMIKEHDGVLTFSLSSIQFGPDSSEFDNISKEQAQRNYELFDEVAEILERYAGYNVTVEGHANNVTGTEREHIEELLPLSQARAETVKRELVKRGIKAERITPIGKGSSAMVTRLRADWWKNRRVEFIMTKAEE